MELKDYQRGFTLIELSIALLVSTILILITQQTISSLSANRDVIKGHSDFQEKLQRTFWWLEQDVVYALSRPSLDSLGTPVASYLLREDLGLELTRSVSPESPMGKIGMLRIGYYLKDKSLYRLIWPTVDKIPNQKPYKTMLISDVDSVLIEAIDENGKSSRSWPLAEDKEGLIRLPVATRITLSIKGRGKVTRTFMGQDFVEQIGVGDALR